MSPAPDSLEDLDSGFLNSINAELNNWQHAVFQGEMDTPPNPADEDKRDSDPSARLPLTPVTSSPSTPVAHDQQAATPTNVQQVPGSNPLLNPALGLQLTPEVYNHLIHALLTLQQSQQHPPAGSGGPGGPGGPGYHPTLPPGQLAQSVLPIYGWSPSSGSTASIASNIVGTSPAHPQGFRYDGTNPLLFPGSVPQPTTSPAQPMTQSAVMSRQTQGVEAPEEAISIAEDKRRRNTAASARFRVKKKLKTLHLERTVADLSGRAGELEREATDLRRENSWLKEIILLKTRNYAASGSQSMDSGYRQSQEGGADKDLSSEGKDGGKGKGKRIG